IPESLWFAMGMVATHGSPGYAPVTLLGRVITGATMLSGVALFGILTNVIGRALLTSLFGADPTQEDEREKREARRRQVRAGARIVGARVAAGVERAIQAAGPLPALANTADSSAMHATSDPVAARARRTESRGRPLTLGD